MLVDNPNVEMSFGDSRIQQRMCFQFPTWWNWKHICGFIAALWISKKPLKLCCGVPTDMQWEIYALYASASGKVWSPNGLSEAVAITMRVRQ